jgi:hypothetical protein
MHARTLIAALLALAPLGISGCNIVGPAFYFIHGPEKIKKVHTLNKDRSTVIFIDDRLNRIPRRALRAAVGETAERTLMKEGAVKEMISSASAMQAAGNDRGGNPLPIIEIGRAVKADVVIYVTVDQFSLSRDGQAFAPVASIRVKVLDVSSGERAWPEAPAGHPVQVNVNVRQGIAPENNNDRFAAEDELARLLGLEIAGLFYDHESIRGTGRGVD